MSSLPPVRRPVPMAWPSHSSSPDSPPRPVSALPADARSGPASRSAGRALHVGGMQQLSAGRPLVVVDLRGKGAAAAAGIALAFHVDYWDRLGWTDRLCLAGVHRAAVRRNARKPRALRLYARRCWCRAGTFRNGTSAARWPRLRRRPRSLRAPRSRSRRNRSAARSPSRPRHACPRPADRKGADPLRGAGRRRPRVRREGRRERRRAARARPRRAAVAQGSVAGRQRRHRAGPSRSRCRPRRAARRRSSLSCRTPLRATCCRRWRCR